MKNYIKMERRNFMKFICEGDVGRRMSLYGDTFIMLKIYTYTTNLQINYTFRD